MIAKPSMQLVLWNERGEIADTVEIPLELAAPNDLRCYDTALLVAQHAERMLQGLRRRALLEARAQGRGSSCDPSRSATTAARSTGCGTRPARQGAGSVT